MTHRRGLSVVYDENGGKVLVQVKSSPAVAAHSASQEEPSWLTAVRAAEEKQAKDIVVLDLTGITSFTDIFVIATGANSRQVQAISDEVSLQLKKRGELPNSAEGYGTAEWILVDYGDFIVHVFSPQAREYYDLERLWRGAKAVEIPAA
jgi:ribosome-associated protein